MPAQLEHVNLTVRSIEETVRFLTAAFPEFKVRGEGRNGYYRWLHVGTEDSYLALGEEESDEAGKRRPFRYSGLNHLGFVVDDVEAIRKRLSSAGYRESNTVPDHPHRKRLYFDDGAGLEWEFVQYLSADPAKRNDYSQ